MSYCTACGTELPQSGNFCPNCGSAIGEPTGSSVHPETGNPVVVEPCGMGLRIVAHLIDGIVVFLIFWLVGSWVASQTGGQTPGGFDLEGTPAMITLVATIVLSILYMSLTEAYWHGQSLGKKILGIQVVAETGGRCSFRQALVRNILRLVDGIVFYLVGLVLALRSKQRQRLGDRAAGTVVISCKPRTKTKDNQEKSGVRFSMGMSSGADYVD